MSSTILSRRAVLAMPAAALSLRSSTREADPRRRSIEWEDRTREALARYRLLSAEDDGLSLPEPDGAVEPGDQYEGLSRLRQLLCRLGDLSSECAGDAIEVYEGELVAGVQHFQTRHGLEPDGRIDIATLGQLNTPLAHRVKQLELAYECWRHLPFDSSRPAIVLNLPEFRLRAYTAADRADLEMKIIIGQAPDHCTPSFSSVLNTVVFHPYWNVPVSIQKNELVTEIEKDPSFLSANHLDVLTADGRLLKKGDPAATADQLRRGSLRLRQRPGPKNVLGIAKFLFPNEYGIYLHGTSAPWLFDKPKRDFSHGCIRVEKADALTEWVLGQQPGWPHERVADALEQPATTAVNLAHRVQIAAVYVTALALENGEVHFFEDVYGEQPAPGRMDATPNQTQALTKRLSGEQK
jgi:murein L,D-transpeptidase YcbB/YkuD